MAPPERKGTAAQRAEEVEGQVSRLTPARPHGPAKGPQQSTPGGDPDVLAPGLSPGSPGGAQAWRGETVAKATPAAANRSGMALEQSDSPEQGSPRDVGQQRECVPENLELKLKILSDIDRYINDSAIISSSTSCLSPTKIFNGLRHVKNCIVAHPVNPPYYVPLVELVPHPETDPVTVEKTYDLMKKIGQSPVKLMKETDGFALNRLQYALISEAWRLVQDGVISPRDVDTVMSEGLGMRYAFLGPLETMHLNAEGFKSYCERYGEGIERVLTTFGPIPTFSGDVAEKIDQSFWEDQTDKPDQLKTRREWRDACLSRLAKLKKEMKNN